MGQLLYSIKFNIPISYKKHRSASAIGRNNAEKISSTTHCSPPAMRPGARRSVVSNTSNHTHTPNLHGGQGESLVPPYTHGSVSLTRARANAWCLLTHTEASLSHTHAHLSDSLTCSGFRRRRRGGTPGAGTRGSTSSSARTSPAPRPRHPSQRVRIIALAASWHDLDSDNEGQRMWWTGRRGSA